MTLASGQLTSRLWTKNVVNGTFVINSDLGLTKISILLISGAATFIGDLQAGVYPSEALALQSGISFNWADGKVLDGITIDASAGSVQIVGN
jgi:hypothetical protein